MTVIGAGVSTSVAGLPSWKGALESALRHAVERHLVAGDEATSLKSHLEAANSPEVLIEIAHAVRERLTGSSSGSGEFATWLKSQFDVELPSYTNARLLRLIHQLPFEVIATTNYDKLLSASGAGLESITWQQPGKLAGALVSRKYVVHLHGVWDEPESVIFGAGDYAAISRVDEYRTFLASLWLSNTMVFIGCSLDGVKDPDFTSFLTWINDTFPDTSRTHYILLKDGYERGVSAELLTRWHLQAVSYGPRYEELPAFLEKLLPAQPSTVPSVPEVFVGRETHLEQLVENISAKRRTLLHGMGGIGKTTLAAAAIRTVKEQRPETQVCWIDGSKKSDLQLASELASFLGVQTFRLTGQQLCRRVLDAVGTVDRLILAIDVPDELEHVHRFLQHCVPANVPVVVMSRNKSKQFKWSLSVESLNQSATGALFTELSGRTEAPETLVRIHEMLEGHPLAVTLAAQKCAMEDLPTFRLLDRIGDQKHRLDALKLPGEPESPSNSVRASVAFSVDGLQINLKLVLTVLSAGPPRASCELLGASLGVSLEEAEDRVGLLVSRSLVRREGSGTVSCHQLTKDFVRESDPLAWRTACNQLETAIAQLAASLESGGSVDARRVILDLEAVLWFLSLDFDPGRIQRLESQILLALLLFSDDGLVATHDLWNFGADQMIQVVDRLMSFAQVAKIDELSITMGLCNAFLRRSTRDPESAVDVLSQILPLTSGENEHLRPPVLVELGNSCLDLYDHENAFNYLEDALESASRLNDESARVQALEQLGHVLFTTGNFSGAGAKYAAAKGIAERLGHRAAVAVADYYLAEIERHRGNISHAWSLHLEGLRIEKERGNPRGVLNSLERLAEMVDSSDRLNAVITEVDIHNDALGLLASKVDDALGESIKGLAFFKAGDLQKAEEHTRRSLDARIQAKSVRGAAVAYGTLSVVALYDGRVQEAQSLNSLSQSMYLRANDPEGVYKCWGNQIGIAAMLGDQKLAVDAVCQGIPFCLEHGNLIGVVQLWVRFWGAIPIARTIHPLRKNFPDISTLVGELIRAAANRDLPSLFGAVNALHTLLQRSAHSLQGR